MEILNKITNFFKKYGCIGIVIHFSISFISLLLIYLLLIYGINLQQWMKSIGINLDKYRWSQQAGELAIGFMIYKIISPLRYGLLILLVPIVKRIIDNKKEKEFDIENEEYQPINEKDSETH